MATTKKTTRKKAAKATADAKKGSSAAEKTPVATPPDASPEKKATETPAVESKSALPKKAAAKKTAKALPKARAQKKPTRSDLSEKQLAALRQSAEQAAAALDAAKVEARAFAEQARTLVREAKDRYREHVAAYRSACRSAGAACELQGRTRRPNVSERTVFQVERLEKGVRVAVNGRPETEEVMPLKDLGESVNRVAYAYTERHLGPREEVGNKGGSLSNRLRRVLEL